MSRDEALDELLCQPDLASSDMIKDNCDRQASAAILFFPHFYAIRGSYTVLSLMDKKEVDQNLPS
jgi:hypothetical protein